MPRGALSSPGIAVARLSANGLSFAAVLQAIATSSDANLLSTPSILTLDNQEAKILVGQEVPFKTGTFTTNANGSDNPFTTIQRKDVGITLTVTPHVHDGTSVRLDVEQEVSNLVLSSLGRGIYRHALRCRHQQTRDHRPPCSPKTKRRSCWGD